MPQWQAVRDALADWDGEGVPDRVVRRGAGLLLEALEELSDALDTDVPPITLKPDASPEDRKPEDKRPEDRKPEGPPGPEDRAAR